MGDDAAAITKFTLALRRWYRQVLGWPRASPIAAIHWEVDISNSLRLVLGRAFPLFGRLCATDLQTLALLCPQTCSFFMRGTGAHWCVLTPCSPPVAVARWCSWEIGVRLDRDVHHRLATVASDLHGFLVDVTTDLRLPARDNAVCSRNFPFAWSRLWGLARWARSLCDRSVRSKLIGSPSNPCSSLKVLYIFKADTCSSHLLFASSGLFDPPEHNTESE